MVISGQLHGSLNIEISSKCYACLYQTLTCKAAYASPSWLRNPDTDKYCNFRTPQKMDVGGLPLLPGGSGIHPRWAGWTITALALRPTGQPTRNHSWRPPAVAQAPPPDNPCKCVSSTLISSHERASSQSLHS